MMIVFDLFTQLILLLILVQLYKLSKFLTLRIFEMLFDIEHIKIELKNLKILIIYIIVRESTIILIA